MSEGQTPAAAPESQEQQNTASQVAGLPLFKSTYDMVSSALASAKETHPSIKYVCEAAEKGVTAIAGAAVTGASLAVTVMEPLSPVANEDSCQSLETLPIQEPADKDLLDTEEVDAKDAVNNRMTDVIDVTKETLQGSVETMKSAMTSTAMDSTVCQMARRGVEAVLEKSEGLMDHCLPITDEELATLPVSVEGAEGPAVQHQGYFVQLGSLSAQLRQRAYHHSLGKVRQAKQYMQENFLQFHEVLSLVDSIRQNVDQKLQDSQQKLHRMWLEWSSRPLEGSDDAPSPEPEQVESQTLAMSQSITQQLQDICQSLKASIQGVPSSIEDKVQQVLQNLEELHSSFFTAKSFQDLPSASQSQEKISKTQEIIDELLEYVEYNTPFSWLVGPFTPSGRAYVTPKEEVTQKKTD
ncbi:perilipin-3-like [Pelodiscus sinensis]|uniref:perilipin-3-like n=1 Tax=Pelodiscus sinensis TaxID=13735 RepID=UPI000D721338|nr:perilipin-3-like [Pelodiscus sinensis]|eukprot:XP_006113662.2 perilipin-3-like [Pelodiscus sinensis]